MHRKTWKSGGSGERAIVCESGVSGESGREAGGRRPQLGEEMPAGSSEPSPTSATFPALPSCGQALPEGPAPGGDQTKELGELGAPVASPSLACVRAGGWTEARRPGLCFQGPVAAGGLSSTHCPQRDGHSPRRPHRSPGLGVAGRPWRGGRPAQRALSGTARPASGQRRTTLTRPVSRGVAHPDWRPRHQLRLCESCPRQPGMCQEWRCDDLMR